VVTHQPRWYLYALLAGLLIVVWGAVALAAQLAHLA
jgi:hypothetical protein